MSVSVPPDDFSASAHTATTPEQDTSPDSTDTQEPIASEDAIEQALFLCSQFATQIAIADTKAAYTLGSAAILATVASFDRALVLTLIDTTGSFATHVIALLTIMTFALILISVYDSLVVTMPSLPIPKRHNLYYFVSINSMMEDDYRQAFLAQNTDEVQVALFNQVHILAQITYRKFFRVRRSLYLLVAAFLFWLLAQVLQTLT
jgi:hypothetical protein